MSDKKSFLDDINKTKPESFNEEEFIKQKKNLAPSIITSAAVLVAIAVLALMFFRGTAVPDMSGWKSDDVRAWAEGTNAVVVYIDGYSSEFSAGEVMSVQPDTGVRVGRNGTVTVKVSKGADPNERIDFPDLKNMILSQINKWTVENDLTGITIKKENSSVFEKDSVINYEMIDGNEADFIRKDRVRIYISLGPKVLDETVSVPDFSSYDKAQVLKWGHDNEITIEFMEQFSDFIENGKVSKQSIESYTKMNRTDVLVITMSLGRAIRVPDFTGMTREEAADAADKLGIQLQYESEISNKTIDTVLAQDIKAGSDIHSKQMITLTLAAESENIIVPDLFGMNSSDASGIAGIHGLKTFFMDKESPEPAGTVIGMSVQPGTEISKEETVFIYVSKGNVMVPDFSEMTLADVELWSRLNNTTITFIEIYSDDWAADRLFGQNFINTLLPEGEPLLVYRSLGQIEVRDFTGSSKLDVIEWQREVNSKGGEIWLKFHTVDIPGMEGNRITDQSVKNDYIPAQSRLDLWVTTDKEIVVPDMTAVSEDVFITWCQKNGISYVIEEIFSSDYNDGVLFGQNFTDMKIPDGSKLVIYKSLGKPRVIDFAGYSETEVRGWVNGMNLKGAGFELDIEYEESTRINEGKVIDQTPVNRIVPTGSMVSVTISTGKPD